VLGVRPEGRTPGGAGAKPLREDAAPAASLGAPKVLQRGGGEKNDREKTVRGWLWGAAGFERG